ncbi:MAG: sterol desaturase family protein [Bacteroidetes bacterium]|nr:sterol desaturase family protein [Bacteroidota bacterium]
MAAEDLLGLMIPLTYLLFLLVEQFWPARTFPAVRWWRSTGVLFVIVLLTINVMVPLLLPHEWIAHHSLLNLQGLGIVGGAIVGYLAVSLVGYVWHRLEHRYNILWRLFHQLHHSPNRMDISGAAFTHPNEVIMGVILSIGITVLVLGLDPVAAALTGYIGAFYSMFQHWNIRTPQWLGYIIERPESHCRHHELGIHAYNYSDLPLWDIVFGTFRNPATFEGEVGFEGGASRRIAAMLAAIDVNAGGAPGGMKNEAGNTAKG